MVWIMARLLFFSLLSSFCPRQQEKEEEEEEIGDEQKNGHTHTHKQSNDMTICEEEEETAHMLNRHLLFQGGWGKSVSY